MKKAFLFSVGIGLAGAALLAAPSREPAIRRFTATYVATIAPLPEGATQAEVWLPVPSSNVLQNVEDVKVDAPAPVTFSKDSGGNAVAHFTLDPAALAGKPTEARVSYRVERHEALLTAPADRTAPASPDAFLAPDRMVPLSARVRNLASRLAAGKSGPLEEARAFYEYLVKNGTYDKTTPGWGHGDSERFCDLKKGNCTDFHSLFMALARSEGIPVRFNIGFPLGKEKEGTVPGYHCWAEFWAPGRGWIPVDASQAAQSHNPAREEYLFGNLDADRFQITSGRDLTLSPRQKEGPINFFIYPYVEVDGKTFGETKITLEYRDL